jgi:crossover junction endodeoxyribonuclease RuvC
MRVIGLDLSLTGTAACAVSEQMKCEFMYSPGDPEDAKLPMVRRLLKLNDAIMKIVYGCDLVFVEGFSFASKGRSVVDIGGLGWMVRTGMYEGQTPYFDVPPKTLKMFITGKGNSNKEVTLEQVFRKYGLGSEFLSNNNEVDAYALGVFGQTYLGYLKGMVQELTEYQKRSFKKMAKVPTCFPRAWPEGLPRHPEASSPTQ